VATGWNRRDASPLLLRRRQHNRVNRNSCSLESPGTVAVEAQNQRLIPNQLHIESRVTLARRAARKSRPLRHKKDAITAVWRFTVH